MCSCVVFDLGKGEVGRVTECVRVLIPICSCVVFDLGKGEVGRVNVFVCVLCPIWAKMRLGESPCVFVCCVRSGQR